MTEDIDVAVLLDSRFLYEWQRKALERLVFDPDLSASITTIIFNEDSDQSSFPSQLQSLLFDFSLYKGLIAVRELSRRLFGQPWYRELTHISEIPFLSTADTVECVPQSADGIGNTLSSEGIKELSQTDIAVRFGFGILKGEALNTPTYGVLSYHHGDLREYRGRPAGFYEFLNQDETAGVTIQKLNETLDGGAIVAMTRIECHTARSWSELRSRLFAASVDLLTEAVACCVDDSKCADIPDSLGELYTTPSNRQVLAYLSRCLRNVVRPPC